MQQGLNIVNPYQTLKDRVNGINSMVIKSSQTLKCDNLIFGTESSIVHGSIVNTLPAHSGELYVEKNYHLSNDSTMRTGSFINNTLTIDEQYENNFEPDQYVYIRGAGTVPTYSDTEPITVTATSTEQFPEFRYQYCVVTVKKITVNGVAILGGLCVGAYSDVVYNVSKLDESNFNACAFDYSHRTDAITFIIYRKALDDSETQSGWLIDCDFDVIDADNILGNYSSILDDNFYLSDIIPEEGESYPGDVLSKIVSVDGQNIILEATCAQTYNTKIYHDNTIPLNIFFTEASNSNKSYTLGGSEDVFIICDQIYIKTNTKLTIDCSIMAGPYIYIGHSILYIPTITNVEIIGSRATTHNNIDGNRNSSSGKYMNGLITVDGLMRNASSEHDYGIQFRNMSIGNTYSYGLVCTTRHPIKVSNCDFRECIQCAVSNWYCDHFDIQCSCINCGTYPTNDLSMDFQYCADTYVHDSLIEDTLFSSSHELCSKLNFIRDDRVTVKNCTFINPTTYASYIYNCIDSIFTNNILYCKTIAPQDIMYINNRETDKITVTDNSGNSMENIVIPYYYKYSGANPNRIYNNIGHIVNSTGVRYDIPSAVTVNATGATNYNQFPCNGTMMITSGTISEIVLNGVSLISGAPISLPFSFSFRIGDTYVVNYSAPVTAIFVPS